MIFVGSSLSPETTLLTTSISSELWAFISLAMPYGTGQQLTQYLGSIIAVHGLSGNWRQTWTHDNGRFWLAQFLPVQFPNARVMAYGYNANIFLSKAVTDIKQEAEILLRYLENNRQRPEEKERPILFMGHSLGGILVKKVRTVQIPKIYRTGTSRAAYVFKHRP